ncbi:MAG TPA: NUDIX domain-containing protein [Bacteroidales bacterium]|nr:NUDIX domain-containing protein [Bacteroidales bacterium]HPS15654.1 NUDIX domain-containing protein [Bacteroidales bacterium]
MYKVFINNKCIVFSNDNENLNIPGVKVHQFVSKETLMPVIDVFEKEKNSDKLYVTGDGNKIISLFPVIEAAGGIVKKNTGEILFIFRYGKWDLPKGKCDEGEKPRETAVREVMEETGVKGLSIIKELIPTYHTYRLDGERVIKKTWWFEMSYSDDSAITPQLIEDITLVKWLSRKDIPWAMRDSYASIIELLTQTGYL